MKNLTRLTLTAAICSSLLACGSDNSGSNSSNGYVATGTITGFGSIFVNGVEFETDSSTFDVDGVEGTQDDLAIGMQVGVVGTINDDGVSGTATHVDFDEEIQGPVSNLTAGDGVTRTFTVLGTTVIIDINDTSFDSESGLFAYDTIEENDNVEVSGLYDAAGDLHATRVELEDEDFDSNSLVEIEGDITGLSGTTFTINGVTVDAANATLEDLPDGLVEGASVEVKGHYDSTTETITATEVEGEDGDEHASDDGTEIEIEGFITRYASDSDFDVNDQTVNASSAVRYPSTLILAEGIRVEVEGTIENDILIASEIEDHEED